MKRRRTLQFLQRPAGARRQESAAALMSVAHGHAAGGATATPGTPKVFQGQTLSRVWSLESGVWNQSPYF